jgi:type VI secretion system protein ImpE
MTAAELYRAGKLDEAIEALGPVLRSNPTDVRSRTFLFELLCFAGQYDRAQKQLEILAGGGADAATGSLIYHAVLHAERQRQERFASGEYPAVDTGKAPSDLAGTLNGQPFESIEDADPRVGARLEVFSAGDILLIPFVNLAQLKMDPPQRLRDLLWAPARLETGPALRDMELGEVLMPVLAPLSWRHEDPNVRLGRATVWKEDETGQAVPLGQKMLLVDGEEFPYLEVREIEIRATAPAS